MKNPKRPLKGNSVHCIRKSHTECVLVCRIPSAPLLQLLPAAFWLFMHILESMGKLCSTDKADDTKQNSWETFENVGQIK